ncbi:MAG: hypothetical protein ACR2PL_08285 [Dehalococcoidia bacterium]
MSSGAHEAEDLIIYKALFNRSKDWVDIENILKVQQHVDEQYLRQWLRAFTEPDDERVTRIEDFIRRYRRGSSLQRR